MEVVFSIKPMPLRQGKAGQTAWTPAGKHLPENVTDKRLEAILVELKAKPAKAKLAKAWKQS